MPAYGFTIFLLLTPLLTTAQEQKRFVFPTDTYGEVVLQLTLATDDIAAARYHADDWYRTPVDSNNPEARYIQHVRGMFAESKPRLRAVYQIFERTLPGVPTTTFDELLVAFVQSIPYGTIPDRLDGQATHGLFPPLVVLREGYGDCDSKSLLLAALVTHRHPVLYLINDRHVFVGLPGNPAPGQHYVTIDAQTWLLCEMTDRWGIGNLPPESIADIARGGYQYILLK